MKKGRRDFIKQLALAGFAVQMTGLLSCTSHQSWPKVSLPTNLTPQDLYFINQIHRVLFPDDGNGPTLEELHSIEHVLWSISLSENDEQSYFKGLNAAKNLFAQHIHDDYRDISPAVWEELTAVFVQHTETKDWIKTNLIYILESLSIDPIYGVNQNEIGWNWLEHQPGFPRPDQSTKYHKI